MCVNTIHSVVDRVNPKPRTPARKEAQAAGATHYRTGEPCKSGHIADRLTSTGQCVDCLHARYQVEKASGARRIARAKYRAENLEKDRARIRDIMRARYARDPSASKAATRKWYLANREAAVERAREYYRKNLEAIRIKERARYEVLKHTRTPEQYAKILANARNHRARRRSAPGTHTAEDIQFLHIMQDGQCAACTLELAIAGCDIDHIIPLSRGGSNDADNLQLLCPSCNRSKGAKLMDEWIATRGW